MSLVEHQPCRETQAEVAKLFVVYQKGFTHKGSIFFPFTRESFCMYVRVYDEAGLGSNLGENNFNNKALIYKP